MNNNNRPLKNWYIELELILFQEKQNIEQLNILLSG